MNMMIIMMIMIMMIMMIMIIIMMIFTRLCCTEAVAGSSGIDNGFDQETREAGTNLKQNHCLIFDLYLIFDLLWWRLFDGSSPTCKPTHLPTYLTTYLPTCLSTYLH